MRGTQEKAKAELLDQAARSDLSVASDLGLSTEELAAFLSRYYRHAATDDLLGRSPENLLGAAVSQYQLAAQRPQGTANIRVYTPGVASDGWSAADHTVVEVVTDDMPFLVDSVTMLLSQQNRAIHVVIHPQLTVRRDLAGALLKVIDTADPHRMPDEAAIESWMHIEIDRETDPERLAALTADLQRVLHDVREVVEDENKMRDAAARLSAELRGLPAGTALDDPNEVADLLDWLADDHFIFLGFREYALDVENGEDVLRPVPGTGLGILRADSGVSTSFSELSPEARARAKDRVVLSLTKANSRATVHRPSYLDYVGVRRFDESGNVVGERRFLGLFSTTAYRDSVRTIPVLRRKVEAVLERSGFPRGSYGFKALRQVLETYPRDELFQISADDLLPIATSVLHLQERRRLRLFLRRDDYGRFISALVYLPRDRYTTDLRLRMQAILMEGLGGISADYTANLSESVLVRVHFIVRLGQQSPPDYDLEHIEARLAAATRSWRDDFAEALVGQCGEEQSADLSRKYADAFPESYKEAFSASTAVADLRRLEALPDEGFDVNLYLAEDAEPGERRFKIYRTGAPLSLSEILPVLQRMGVEVVDEHPYEIERAEAPAYIYDFGLRYNPTGAVSPDEVREQFQEAFVAAWRGEAEVDGFNALVLLAGLRWREVAVLRAYAKYLRQAGVSLSQDYIEQCMTANLGIARLLVRLFTARLDPAVEARKPGSNGRDELAVAIVEEIEGALDQVASLDQDRILRSFLTLIRATLRTNYFQPAADGGVKSYISFKIDSRLVPDLPLPRPQFEIWVYSPRFEGVHLRFGPVARGGLRWSDRREDFRTEVLGLVKAQMVKNAVIVPVGAKGGFVVKRPPADPTDREAMLAEGIACYRTFICGLLDLTDNLVNGEVVPPSSVVRHDPDDTYLVVAADKGTATFSDIANSVALDYGFWLGDAFASGGSVGYDHKAMGITARGAWKSVERHFRDMGVNVATDDFTVIGIGDMSGDVFGNGMLLSQHIRLVAAFDHRHIFLDPDPDPAVSFAERRRLFDLPRSSWADYNPELISEGGGVFPRTAKSISLTPQVRARLGIADEIGRMTPNELMHAILLAPVDLLWNGGIGTYVKAAVESNADVGDKANDSIRVDGADLRVKAVGEGGNLGFTQLGRVEYALAGGRINTDAIDNSAGVDTSDHEVNIKILLNRLVADGELTQDQRNELLAESTDEVAELVLRDNYDQNLAIAGSLEQATGMLHIHARLMRQLEQQGHLDRALEFLPSDRQLKERQLAGIGLTAPEFAILLAYQKIRLAEELITSDLPDDPFLRGVLQDYFPIALQERFPAQIDAHPLRRQIITTVMVNGLVNLAGITFMYRLREETGASAADVTRAHVVAHEVFAMQAHWESIEALDSQVPAKVQTHMRLEGRRLVERSVRWLLHNRRSPIDMAAEIVAFRAGVAEVIGLLPKTLRGVDLAGFEQRRDELTAAGVPAELAVSVAGMTAAYSALDIVEVATDAGVDVAQVAEVYFDLADRLPLARLLERVNALSRDDRWKTLARAALRDELYSAHAALTFDVLSVGGNAIGSEERFEAWYARNTTEVARARQTLEEIVNADTHDLATMLVAMRVLRTLLRREALA
ncbi:MAG: NAD-glutamate dehydrogenase [Sporichthyaceae bacterium]|nr:NAD-glutamate dehydrogenase [Sporichthyaceae bacterium]